MPIKHEEWDNFEGRMEVIYRDTGHPKLTVETYLDPGWKVWRNAYLSDRAGGRSHEEATRRIENEIMKVVGREPLWPINNRPDGLSHTWWKVRMDYHCLGSGRLALGPHLPTYEERQQSRALARERGYTHELLGVDGDPGVFWNDPEKFSTMVRESRSEGFASVVVLLNGNTSLGRFLNKTALRQAVRDIVIATRADVSFYVAGWELDEVWSDDEINDFGRFLRQNTTVPLGVHFGPRVWAGHRDEIGFYSGGIWDAACLQFPWDYSLDQLKGDCQDYTAPQRLPRFGVKLIAFEYAISTMHTEDQARAKGRACLAGGAVGVANGC